MNMMDQAKLEDAARGTWERRGALKLLVSRTSKCDEWKAYHLGFLAGARWRDKQHTPICHNDRMVIDRAAEDEG